MNLSKTFYFILYKKKIVQVSQVCATSNEEMHLSFRNASLGTTVAQLDQMCRELYWELLSQEDMFSPSRLPSCFTLQPFRPIQGTKGQDDQWRCPVFSVVSSDKVLVSSVWPPCLVKVSYRLKLARPCFEFCRFSYHKMIEHRPPSCW